MVASERSGKLLIKLRKVVSSRSEPRIPRVEPSPFIESVLRKKQQVQGLIGKQVVVLQALLELHRFIPDPQRAHLEPAKITVRRRCGSGQFCHQ